SIDALLMEIRRRVQAYEDQDTQDSQGDPPADGEAGTRGAPMKPVTYLEDHRAPDVDDMLERVTAEAERQDDEQDLSAARHIDEPTQGELRRRPGKDAGEENQDPGDDWD